MAFDFDALFAPQPTVPQAVKDAVKDAVFSFREPVKARSDDAEPKPWAERLEPVEDTSPRILEIDGIRAICTPDRWMCFYAIDPGKPFISETGFMSGCSSRKGSSEETFAALLAERRKQHKGKLPLPATTYRLPEPGEDGPQAATGALLALKKLKTEPYNAALLIEANGQWGDGACSEHGKPERLKDCTKGFLPPNFDVEVDAKGHGFAIIGPNGRRWPEAGSYFPALHNIRCAVTRQARDDAETNAPFFYATIPQAA
ncbi:hypothetical protein IC232_03210 [Microvirga sp. BT688]|uniref:hypothetical protein n=1 Tax=Microvirga sp. TaxID=1873136 RepID=UPI0016865E15|nr:hypothetical protein [Microvirga sp.]MBD2745697.1 hypothetical protein [Microvirga sp.]